MRAEPLQIGVQCDTTEETLERIAEWAEALVETRERLSKLPDAPWYDPDRYAVRQRLSGLTENIKGAQHYVDAARLIDQSGPYCTVEAHVGGITINFQGCRVICSGSVKVERRTAH